MGHMDICDQQSWSYKRDGLSLGWSLKGGTTVHCTLNAHLDHTNRAQGTTPASATRAVKQDNF